LRVSGNTVIAGRSRLADRVWVGTSASVAQGLSIGEGAQVKMGAVVVADVPPGASVSGNFAVNHRINMARYLKGAVQ
jgi:acetyltransferase-like isoleucine patch superfamily enzyme